MIKSLIVTAIFLFIHDITKTVQYAQNILDFMMLA